MSLFYGSSVILPSNRMRRPVNSWSWHEVFHVDKDVLTDVLQRALEAGITTEPTPSHLGSRPACRDESIQRQLTQFLSGTGDLTCFDRTMFSFGFWGAVRISREVLAMHLLHRASKVGPNQTAAELQRFLDLDHTPAYAVLAVRGIETTQETDITDDIRLIPYDAVPQSLSKDMADSIAAASEQAPFMAPQRGESLRPKAALVKQIRISPKTCDATDDRVSPDEMSMLRQVCSVLTLVGRSTPMAFCSWVDIEEWVPCRDLLSCGVGGTLVATESLPLHKMTDDDCSDASMLSKQFLRLEHRDQETLLTSLDRLNRSKRRFNAIDKAIDLGIAMEILLLHDRSKHDQIAFPFRLRGAWLLAKSAKERIKIERTLNSIYDCRCQAVHSGKCEAPTREESLPRLFERGQDLCAEVARCILRRGVFPDWHKLVLGGEG